MSKKNHVGRPSNEELRIRRNKKIAMTIFPIALSIIAIIYITINGVSQSMGNSVVEYYCEDPSYSLDGTNCKKTLKEKSIYLGDINQDGKITTEDYELLSKYVELAFNDSEDEMNLSDLQVKAADVDESGEVYAVDETIMREYFDGTVSTYGIYKENIGVKRLCNTGYELKGEFCYKEDVVKALVEEKKLDTPTKVDKKTYTIHYNANGGTGSIKDQEITYGIKTRLNKNTFTKKDSNFEGWKVYNENRKQWACYKNANKTDQGYTNNTDCNNYGYVIYNDEQVVSETASPGETITMYAIWNKVSYFTIKYSANGGKGTIANQKITYGVKTKLSKNVFTKDNNTFGGWKVYNNNRKQWACYKNANKSSQGYTNSTDCNNYGYVIYNDEQVVSETASPGETITMYAIWNKVSYFTIKYSANGGKGTIANQKITYGVKTKLSKNVFTKDNNTFGGWKVYNNNRKQWACYKNANKTSQGYTNSTDCNNYGYVIYNDEQVVSETASPGETITMYAIWNKVSYFTIKYNANGGTGTMANQKITYDTKTKLNLNSFTKSGSTFAGWKVYNNNKKQWICYLDSNKSKQDNADDSVCKKYGYVIYSNGQNVSRTASPGETITMYAQWNKTNHFTIQYNANGGTGTMANQNIVYDTKTKLNKNSFSRANYYFIGWRVYNNSKKQWICYLNSNKTSQNDANESVCKKYGYVIYKDNQTVSRTASPGETITMYALWQYSYKNISTSFNGFEKDVKGATVWPMVNINFYKNSNGTSKIGTIPQGTALKAIDMTNKTNESKSYVKVKYNNKEGYIDGWLTMINLPDVIPSALYNITNASSSLFKSRSHNLSGVTGNDIYGSGWNSNMAPIRIETAKKLQKVQTAAKVHGNKIKIYDSFRPWTAQRKVANAVNANWFTGKTYYITKDFDNRKNTNGYYQTYIGDYKGWFIATATSNPSSHNVAKAVDTTMVFSDDNQEIPTQSAMHELSGNSIPTQSAVDNNKGELALNYLFTSSGFYFLPSEWWHFEDVNNTGYGSYYSQIKCLGNPYASNAYNCKVNQLKLAK